MQIKPAQVIVDFPEFFLHYGAKLPPIKPS